MSSEWPLGERLRAPARPTRARRRPLPRVTWLLVAAAFLLGALLSAAAFSIGWRHASTQTSSLQGELDRATARNSRLAASLAAAQARAARATGAQAAAAKAATRVSREASTLATALVASGKSADSVSVGAAAVGSDLDRLAGELRTLTTYLSATPAAQLDPGYVATQTAYLAKQLDTLRGERSDLAAAIADFDSGAKSLADRASVLAGRD